MVRYVGIADADARARLAAIGTVLLSDPDQGTLDAAESLLPPEVREVRAADVITVPAQGEESSGMGAWHVNEATEPVDNLGGILSAVLVGGLVLAINFAPLPAKRELAFGLLAIAVAAGIGFIIRQKRVANPLYDLDVAARRIFWVAACAGLGALRRAAPVRGRPPGAARPPRHRCGCIPWCAPGAWVRSGSSP